MIIGYGSIGKRHLRNIESIEKTEIIVCTKRKDLNSLKRKNIKIFPTIEKCISEKPDFAVITNETAYHITSAIKLAKNGIDLFIEKPLSNSNKNVKLLEKIVKEKKLVTQMGFNLRFHECIKKIKQLVNQKKIGKIISIQCQNGSYLPDWHPHEDYRQSYAGKQKLGGGIILTMIHDIDYLYWIFGQVKQVFSVAGKYSDLDISAEDYCASIIRFKNKITAEIHLDFFLRPEFRGCKIKGTKGMIYWDSNDNIVKLFNNTKKTWKTILKLKKFQRNQMYIDEMRHFMKCVKKRQKTINDLQQGIITMNIALAMKNSAKKGKLINI